MNKGMMAVAFLAAAVAVNGCFPIELSVSPQGDVIVPRQEGFVLLPTAQKAPAKVIYTPKDEQPTYGAFAPDGKNFLAISQTKGGMGDMVSVVRLAPLAGGAAKDLTTVSNLLYVRWSPDGKLVSLARASDVNSKALDKKMPELILLNAADGSKKPLLSDVAALHRWTSDSKGIIAMHVASREKDGDQYVGKLVRIDVATGKTTELASVLAGDKISLDVSPDGKKVLMVALKVAPAAQAVPAKSSDKPALFEIDLAAGAVRQVKENALQVAYSPKGDKVLVGVAEFGENNMSLAVSDTTLKTFKLVAADAAKSAGQSDIYPGWLNDDTVLYIGVRAVYGTEGKNFQLYSVPADGKGRQNYQPTLDQVGQ